MLPIEFDGWNVTMRRPDSMTDEECSDLHARVMNTYRGPQYTTCWKPSYEDLQAIQSGKPLVIEFHLDIVVYVNIDTRAQEYPSLFACKKSVVWAPGAVEMADLKSGRNLYITFVSDSFPVISVYINES